MRESVPIRDIRPFVMYCVNGKPRSSLLIESTDSMIIIIHYLFFSSSLMTVLLVPSWMTLAATKLPRHTAQYTVP